MCVWISITCSTEHDWWSMLSGGRCAGRMRWLEHYLTNQSISKTRCDDGYDRVVFVTGRLRTRTVKSHFTLGERFRTWPGCTCQEQGRDARFQRHHKTTVPDAEWKTLHHLRSCVNFCFGSEASFTNRWLLRLNCLPFCCVWMFPRHHNHHYMSVCVGFLDIFF